MDYGAVAGPDGPGVEVRGLAPLRGRGRLVALFSVALVADFTMRFAFFSSLVSAPFFGSAPWTFLLFTAAEWIGGLCSLLIPVAIVVRTPDAWDSRRALLLGALMIAASEVFAAAAEGSIALGWRLLPGGLELLWVPLTQGIDWTVRLLGIAAAVLIGYALSRSRTRPVPGSAWRFIGAAILAAAAAQLLSRGGAGVVGPGVLTAAVLWMGILAGSYRIWAIIAGWFAGESPRRPWALASVGLCFSILASVMVLSVETWPGIGEPGAVAFALIATAGAILTLSAFADGLGARANLGA